MDFDRFCKLLAVFGIFSIAQLYGQENFVEIKVRNSPDSIAYLGYHFADKRFVRDTAVVEDDVARFESTDAYNPGLYFYYTPNVYFEFIVNEAEIIIETEGDDYVKNMIVHKSEENKVFLEMQRYVSSKRMEYNELSKLAEENKEDSTLMKGYRDQLKAIDENVKAYQQDLAARHEGSFAARMVRAMQKPVIPDSLTGEGQEEMQKRYSYYKDHFFDGIDLTDAGLLRSPLMNQKILEYFDEVVMQIPDSVIREVDWYLQKVENHPEIYRYALVTLSNKFETSSIMGMDKVFVHIVEKYYLSGSADWVDDETIQKLNERIATMKPNFIGNQAPPLVLNDTLLSSVSLYDIPAEYTVLYFYDPDCGHCKKKTPVLYEAYSKLRNLNVEVLAICITTDTDRWKEYILENSFDWVNLADTFAKSNFRYYYDIRSTPVIYILDKEKKIIAKKLDAEQVEPFINQMMELQSEGD